MNRLTISCLPLLFACFAGAAEAPRAADNGWDAKLFAYDRPDELVVEVTTPTEAQTSIWHRPAPMPADAPDPVRTTGDVKPSSMGGVRVWHLRFKDATGQIVPALLCEPKEGSGPWPLVVAIHGLTSNKAQVCWQIAGALTARGFGVLAPDLPCHGERAGDPFSMIDDKKRFALWRDAVIDVHQLIDFAQTRHELNERPGVALVGYSLGSWIGSIAGPGDERVRAMVLMVGGAWDTPAQWLKDPKFGATDPRLSLAHFAGRPLLFLNGKDDRIVKRDLSDRLFAAAPEPKKQTFYDSGHLLPGRAYTDAAAWLAELPAFVKPPAAAHAEKPNRDR